MVMSLSCLKSFIGSHCPQDEGQVTPMTYKAFCYLAPVCLSSLIFLCFLTWTPCSLSLCNSAHVFPSTWDSSCLVNAWSFSKMLRHRSLPTGSPTTTSTDALGAPHWALVKTSASISTLVVCMHLNCYLFTMCSLIWGSQGKKTASWSLNLYHLTKYLAHNRHGIEKMNQWMTEQVKEWI